MDQLPKMLSFVAKQAKSLSFSNKDLKQIELVAEEALVNILSYAYPKQAKGKVKISCTLNSGKDRFYIVIEDQGIPFNPVAAPVVSPKDIPLEKRSIGGLGRFFITELMDEVTYSRKQNTNILCLSKSIPHPC